MSTEVRPTRTIKLYISYAPEDERLKKKLLKQLSPMKRLSVIEYWDVQQAKAGEKKEEEIIRHMKEANIILCLLSPDFINSNSCFNIEMPYALERHNLEDVPVIPLLLRYVEWQTTPLGGLQPIPRNRRPITDWPKQDKIVNEAAQEIIRVVYEQGGQAS